MNVLKMWLLGIVAAAMAVSILYALVPRGALLTVARCTGGLVMMLVVLRPLLALDWEGISMNYDDWRQTIQQQTEDYTAANRQQMETIIQTETAAYIQEKAAALGLDCHPRVTCQVREGVPFPAEVVLDIPKNAALSQWMAEELAIHADHQRWREG